VSRVRAAWADTTRSTPPSAGQRQRSICAWVSYEEAAECRLGRHHAVHAAVCSAGMKIGRQSLEVRKEGTGEAAWAETTLQVIANKNERGSQLQQGSGQQQRDAWADTTRSTPPLGRAINVRVGKKMSPASGTRKQHGAGKQTPMKSRLFRLGSGVPRSCC